MMSIGEVLRALESCRDDAPIYFDFGSCVPTRIDSWRGIYAEPALGWATPHSGTAKKTVAQMREELIGACNGQIFYGWKGGEYTFNLGNDLHIDNRGEYSSTELQHVEDKEWCVLFHTEYEELKY